MGNVEARGAQSSLKELTVQLDRQHKDTQILPTLAFLAGMAHLPHRENQSAALSEETFLFSLSSAKLS